MKKLYLYKLLFILMPFLGYSQGQNNFWYFGDKAGVNFANGATTTTPTPVFDANSVFGTAYGTLSCSQWTAAGAGGSFSDHGGCATISKADGSLLFYTNGEYVYNKLHQQMTGLQPLYEFETRGSKQSAVIIPNPSNSNQYYIISSCQRNTVNNVNQWGYYLAIVDFSSNPNGQIISSRQTFTVYCQGYQALTVTKNFNGDGFWVLIPKGTETLCTPYVNELLAFKVDSSGLATTPTVISNLDYNLYFNSEIKVSSQKISPKLCISGSNSVYINPLQKLRVYSFNRQTGQISSNYLLNVDNIRVFSTEFSADGNLLYAIIATTNGNRLVVFDINSPSTPYRVVSNTEVFGSLQTAIDGNIYFTNKSDQLYKIDNQNSFLSSSISSNTINLNNRCTFFGLPQLVPTFGWPEEACTSLTVNSEIHTGTHVYQNYSNITAQTNYIVNAVQDITMHAEDFTVLMPNTHIYTKDGARFWAKPQDCSSGRMGIVQEENNDPVDYKNGALEKQLKLFPNPSKSMVTIASNHILSKITVVSIDGKEVFSKNSIENTAYDLDVSNFSNGIYIVTVQTKDGAAFTEKLFKN